MDIDSLTLPLERPERFGPTPAYRELRRSAPVGRVVTAAGESAWLVSAPSRSGRCCPIPGSGSRPPAPARAVGR